MRFTWATLHMYIMSVLECYATRAHHEWHYSRRSWGVISTFQTICKYISSDMNAHLTTPAELRSSSGHIYRDKTTTIRAKYHLSYIDAGQKKRGLTLGEKKCFGRERRGCLERSLETCCHALAPCSYTACASSRHSTFDNAASAPLICSIVELQRIG